MESSYVPANDLRFYRLPLVIVGIGVAMSVFAFVGLLALRHADSRAALSRRLSMQADAIQHNLLRYEKAASALQKRLEKNDGAEAAYNEAAPLPGLSLIASYDVTEDALSVAGSGEGAPNHPDFLRATAMAALAKGGAALKFLHASPYAGGAYAAISVPYPSGGRALLMRADLAALFASSRAPENTTDAYLSDAAGEPLLRGGEDGDYYAKTAKSAANGLPRIYADSAVYSRDFTFFGEKLTLSYVPNARYAAAAEEDGYMPWAALAFGVGLTLAMGLPAFMVGRDNKRISRQAAERALALELQNRHLEHLARCLEQSNEDMEQFTYAVSHDLKSPLRSIHTVTQILEESLEGKLSAEEKEYMQIVRTRAAKMGELLEQVLEFARLDDMSRQAIEKSREGSKNGDAGDRIDLQAMLRDICELIHIPENFAVSGDDGLKHFMVDRMPLQQVLQNLVDNALKHHDGASGRVCVSAEAADGDYIRVTVTDDGPGILPEYEEKAFKMFRTLGNKDKSSGNGFGLAMTRRLVLRYGGTISLGACEGSRGLACRFTWPARIDGKRVARIAA